MPSPTTLRKIYFALTLEDQKRLLAFHPRRLDGELHGDKDLLVNIAVSNGIPLGDEGQTMGIFDSICRINHSCTPNSGWTWDPNHQQLREFVVHPPSKQPAVDET